MLGQRDEVLGRLDAFGADACPDALGEAAEGVDQRRLDLVLADSVDEPTVELDDVGTQARELPEAGVAGPGVVGCYAGATRTELRNRAVET